MKEYNQLSKDGVATLIRQDSAHINTVVQVLNLKLNKKGNPSFMVSDGEQFVKAFSSDQKSLDPSSDQNAIIVIKSHVVADNKKSIGLMSFTKLCNYKQKIGDATEFNPEEKGQRMITEQQFPIKPELVIKHEETKIQDTTNKKQPKRVKIQQKEPVNAGQVNQYETIKGLFVGLERWNLLCRVVTKIFSEFTSKKNNDKLTKVLNLELMDKTGMKIKGTFFGDLAEEMNDIIKENSVYHISNGGIIPEKYTNSKNQKFSSPKLSFNSRTKFEQVIDSNIVAKVEDAATPLSQIVQKRNIGQNYDVLAILVRIGQSTSYTTKQKQEKHRRNLTLADPHGKYLIDAVIWRDAIEPQQQWIGKTLILRGFSLNQYKQSINLNSGGLSSIVPVVDHAYRENQHLVMKEFQTYQKLSEAKIQNQENTLPTYYNLKDLGEKIEDLRDGDTIRTCVNVHINRFSLKKWYYQACPHCNRAAENCSTCRNCDKYVEKINYKFVMGLELSDHFGSIWSVAYDEFAQKIFGSQGMSKMIDMEQEALKEETESYLYQEHKLRIYSKKDSQGRIKHIIGKIQQNVNYTETAQKNLQLIRQLMTK